jgi:hypothetical protein
MPFLTRCRNVESNRRGRQTIGVLMSINMRNMDLNERQ